MKYLTYLNYMGAEDIRVFSSMEEHKKVAAGMGHPELLGAGFVRFYPDGFIECYGESLSLGLKSRHPADTKILRRFMELSMRAR